MIAGIGGGVSMDLAKAIAFGTLNQEQPMEKYLTYELSTEGLDHLPVVTIPTNPMSGSETNADVQITLDESGQQVGCPVGKAVFTCLRKSLADHEDIEARGQLLLNSALSLSGINDFGREIEFIPYPLQSFAQRYLGLNYTQALTGLFFQNLKIQLIQQLQSHQYSEYTS